MGAELSPSELLDRVEQLSARVEELKDDQARALAEELVAAVIAMYGDGLRRIIDAISQAREAGATILDQLAQDGAVSSLLLIHDLYPVPLEQRVIEALDTVRPYMESHGGDVELLGLQDGVAKLRLEGSCDGCAASRATLELAIKQALGEHAPDLAGLEVEGLSEQASGANGHAGFELPMVHPGAGPGEGETPTPWRPLEETAGIEPGELRALRAGDAALVVTSLDGALVAYRDACAACGEPLDGGSLEGPMLGCPSCGVEFDLRRAGRAAGSEPLQLTPVPLLEAGGVRVAV
jgi:Fe-S cluster biogenesis protein NfuA/nitrite reductase/ring-hydroxylating ferredoxin subunit